ncbi:TRAP transporter substrate-binding protein DctP [Hoeflea poritis]|uniref:TRAP transporter substrate-binding protein DctP n=1 Tax=Hoeflea poritis TaxID=2993659 RepID=A0ABT4VI06_9HYPH|nr:TRAP transporter substrate-binding protein DctP [Hoeflea poritis]MDA4844300.1 TRAP transporter substrate-binding protein DctP [Hoeflea poritis]
MKYRLFALLCFCLILSGLPVAEAKTIIRVTLQLPETHSLGQNWNRFKEIVERESNGELELQIFPSAQLYKDNQVPEAVGSGAIEAGSAFLGRFTGSVPAVDVVALPFFFKDEAALRLSISSGSPMRQLLDTAILEETGARVLWWQAFGRNVYLSKDAPLSLPDDVRGKKVRSYGKVQSWTIEALGGAPTIMSGSQQFLAYQQGAVDIGMTGASAVESRKLYEVMPYMTLTFDSVIEFVAVMNNDFFEGLSPQNQQLILDAASTVEEELRDAIYAQEAQAVEALRARMTVVDLTAEDRDKWRAATSSVIDRFMVEIGPTGEAVVKAGLEEEGR